ncbi:glycosyltransferase [Winogradskyella wichelsiae]|uniref:glycosyltransferase n=1 Tax=Winogradskyella wichelsiae TaxID=2697007 RepID=UPI0015C80B42|nr:glycosyltransferase [Winogradskyella wichelsiae]
MQHKRVFWMLVGGKNTGSSRIHGYNVHEALLQKGISSKIIHRGNRKLTRKQKLRLLIILKKGDLLILQKRKDIDLSRLLHLLKIKGVHIAFIDCDLPKCEDSLVKYFDYIICTSTELTQLYQSKHPYKNITYIPDAVEYFALNLPTPVSNKKAIYFGWLTEARLQNIESLKLLFKTLEWGICTMSNNEKADIQWFNWRDKETFDIISKHSVSLIPVDNEEASKYKSANRVLQSLAIGNIVLCSDITSYREVINNGENGFICTSPEEWLSALNEISNQDRRDDIVKKGWETAQNYCMDKIIMNWISFLNL